MNWAKKKLGLDEKGKKESLTDLGVEIIKDAPAVAKGILDNATKTLGIISGKTLEEENQKKELDYSKLLFALLTQKKKANNVESIEPRPSYETNPNYEAPFQLLNENEFSTKMMLSLQSKSDLQKEQELKRQLLINNGGGFILSEVDRQNQINNFKNPKKSIKYNNLIGNDNLSNLAKMISSNSLTQINLK
jgi:hypothetical protein